MSLRFEDGSRTDAGCVRTVNEDACLTRSEDALWAVADGMGGHANGGWASAQIVAALAAERCPEDLAGAVTAARSALARANTAIHRMSLAQRRVIGSTVAVLVLRERRFAVLWCGDSRVYRLRDGVLAALTTDHSQVEQMVASVLSAAMRPRGIRWRICSRVPSACARRRSLICGWAMCCPATCSCCAPMG
jgi:serine/threonine-protein phosphatase Stp1